MGRLCLTSSLALAVAGASVNLPHSSSDVICNLLVLSLRKCGVYHLQIVYFNFEFYNCVNA